MQKSMLQKIPDDNAGNNNDYESSEPQDSEFESTDDEG